MKQRICLGHQYQNEKIQSLTSLEVHLVPREEALELVTELINNVYDQSEIEDNEEGETDESTDKILYEEDE